MDSLGEDKDIVTSLLRLGGSRGVVDIYVRPDLICISNPYRIIGNGSYMMDTSRNSVYERVIYEVEVEVSGLYVKSYATSDNDSTIGVIRDIGRVDRVLAMVLDKYREGRSNITVLIRSGTATEELMNMIGDNDVLDEWLRVSEGKDDAHI